MKTQLLRDTSDIAVQKALSVLQNGGLVVFPTDTVYGLGAMVSDPAAIDRLYKVKERSPNKAIAVLIGDMTQLELVTLTIPDKARGLIERFWPGALTLVVPRHPGLPANLSPSETIGVRMPDHTFTRALLKETGPLAATSANLSGGPNPKDAQEVLAQLNGRVELVIDGGKTPEGVPSTVVDCTGTDLVILREGAIPSSSILSS